MTFDRGAESALIEATRIIAREEILPRFRMLAPGDVDAKGNPDDLVTIADKRAEARLSQAIAHILPGAAIVGEEGVALDRAQLDVVAEADLCAIIDPIDGTWNYANGIGVFGVALALTKRDRTIWGGLYDPLGDDWIIAREGQGAWFRASDGSTHPINVGDPPERIEDAFGYAGLYLFGKRERDRLIETLPDFRRVGTLRSSLHEYRLISQGRVDFVLNAILHSWDHAAGVLILTEAGGVARLLDGTHYRPSMTMGRLLTARSEKLWQLLADRFAFLT